MPEITMCTDDKCQKKGSCYRFNATPSTPMQSYFCESPLIDGNCEYFYEIPKHKKLQKDE